MPDLKQQPESKRWPPKVYSTGHDPDPRFTLANERTFLAWIRTALGVLAIGIAADALTISAQVIDRQIMIALCSGLAILIAANAFIRWAKTELALRRNQPLPGQAMAPLLSASLITLALCVLIGITR